MNAIALATLGGATKNKTIQALQKLKPYLHWRRLRNNTRDSNMATVITALALATLGNRTQIGLFLFLVTSPKVAKASAVMTVAMLLSPTVLLCKLRQCK